MFGNKSFPHIQYIASVEQHIIPKADIITSCWILLTMIVYCTLLKKQHLLKYANIIFQHFWHEHPIFCILLPGQGATARSFANFACAISFAIMYRLFAMMQNYTIYAYILYTLYYTADIIIFPLVPGGPLYHTSPPPNFVLLFYEMIFPLILVVVGSDRGGRGAGGWFMGRGN